MESQVTWKQVVEELVELGYKFDSLLDLVVARGLMEPDEADQRRLPEIWFTEARAEIQALANRLFFQSGSSLEASSAH